jgi:hypothetical protein
MKEKEKGNTSPISLVEFLSLFLCPGLYSRMERRVGDA